MCALIFCCKQKTSYELRISDCSSDVCSSYLASVAIGSAFGLAAPAMKASAAASSIGEGEGGQLDNIDQLAGFDDFPVIGGIERVSAPLLREGDRTRGV